MEKRSTSIIGTGALGTVLARALSASGFPIAGLYNRHASKATVLGSELGVSTAAEFPTQKDELGTLIFLSVTDRQIEKTATRLARLEVDFSGTIIVHCSGIKTSAVLSPLRKKGAQIASFHPLQSFTAQSTADDFRNIYMDMEGDEEAITYLNFVCRQIGCHALEINPEAKKYLHASAVMASNYVSALAEKAAQIAELGGVNKEKSLQALKPLLLQSAKNISRSNRLSEALSGPIVRGDVQTVSDHLQLLKDHEDLHSLYLTLGQTLVQVMDHGNLSAEKKRALRQIFNLE